MTKKIKFSLTMKNGIQIRTIEQLQENFDLECVLKYFLEGKLHTWLKDRFYEEECEKLSDLCNINDSKEIKIKICEIFNIEYVSQDEIDIKKMEKRNGRIKLLKQFTDDEKVIKEIDKVVFDQEELADLLDTDIDIIYLVKEKYILPMSRTNICYIGIQNPIITIKSKEDVNFDISNIILEDVTLFLQQPIDIIANNSKGINYKGNTDLVNQVINKNEHYKIYAVADDKLNKENSLLTSEAFDRSNHQVYYLCRSKADGSCEEIFVQESTGVVSFARYENTVFYITREENYNMYKITVDNKIKQDSKIKILSSTHSDKVFCNKNWVAWTDGSVLHKAKHDGSGRQEVLEDIYDDALSQIGDYLFYSENDKLYKFYLEDNTNIQIDIGDKMLECFCTDGEQLYIVTRVKMKSFLSGLTNNPYLFYKMGIDGKNRKLLEEKNHNNKMISFMNIEYQDGILYCYVSIFFGPKELFNKIIV